MFPLKRGREAIRELSGHTTSFWLRYNIGNLSGLNVFPGYNGTLLLNNLCGKA